MNSKEQSEINLIDMVSSLHAAMQLAGGKVLTGKDLREMSVERLLLTLANNNVRFVYTGKDRYVDGDDVVG